MTLSQIIKLRTSNGRSIARFLVNVTEGELLTFKPHHRMTAARELPDRGFGKSARTETERRRPARPGHAEATPYPPRRVEGPLSHRELTGVCRCNFQD